MPPDLNLKKSWNPKLLKNKAKRWKLEHDLLETHKQLKQRELETQKEKEKSELLNLSHNNKEKSDSKIGWIYQNGQSGGSDSLLNNSNSPGDDFLLGKKRIDSLVLESGKSKKEELKNQSKLDKILNSEPTSQDTDKLDKDDPMYALKLQQEKRKKLMELSQSSTVDKSIKDGRPSSSGRHRDDKDHRHRSHSSSHGHSHSHRHGSSHHSSSHSHSSRHRHRSSKEDAHESTERRDHSRERSSIKYRER